MVLQSFTPARSSVIMIKFLRIILPKLLAWQRGLTDVATVFPCSHFTPGDKRLQHMVSCHRWSSHRPAYKAKCPSKASSSKLSWQYRNSGERSQKKEVGFYLKYSCRWAMQCRQCRVNRKARAGVSFWTQNIGASCFWQSWYRFFSNCVGSILVFSTRPRWLLQFLSSDLSFHISCLPKGKWCRTTPSTWMVCLVAFHSICPAASGMI